MAGYQRMVSYLYEYNRGEKGTNVGYAKLEIREDIAKMIVSIRLRSDVTDTCPVGFYYWEGRQAYRVPIGEIKLTGGRVEERLLLPGAKAGESGLPVTQMNGILISLPDGLIGSAWDEQGVPIDTKVHKKEGESELRAAELKAAEVAPTEEEEKNLEKDISDIEETQENKELLQEEASEVFTESLAEAVTTEEALREVPLTEPREGNNYRSKSWMEETQKEGEEAQVRKREEAAERDKWKEIQGNPIEYFFQQSTKMCPFENEAITSCVRIEPADLEYFPKETWILGSNSFLLHGYYTYGHLILAKMKGMGREGIIIGVPGLYQNRERFLARLFGFEYFKPISKTGSAEGDFGYWYLFLPDMGGGF